MTAHQNIIQNVKRRLEVVGLTPSEAAKRAGLATTTVTRPLNDANHLFTLSTSTLQALCEPLQCRLQDLVGEPSLSLGAQLRNARIVKSLKQADVATALGITVQAVCQWETDKSTPTSPNLLNLVAMLGVDLIGDGELREAPRPKSEKVRDGALMPAESVAHTRHVCSETDGARISAHEQEMQDLCVNTPSRIGDACSLHKLLVAADERLYMDDGTPIADKATCNADSELKPAGIPINYRPPFRFEAGHDSNQLSAVFRL